MGIKHLNLSSFGQFRQYRTKNLLQSFTGNVAQSIAFRVVSIYWQGDDPFPPEILAPSDLALLKQRVVMWILWISIISTCSFSGFRILVPDFVDFVDFDN